MNKVEVTTILKKIFDNCGWETELDIFAIQDGVFESLGLTSVETLEYLFWVEHEFNITIEDEDLNSTLVKSLDSLAEYILAKLPEGSINE